MSAVSGLDANVQPAPGRLDRLNADVAAVSALPEERLFRLLDLLHRDEEFRRIYRGLRSPNRRVQASSRELLENVLRPPLKVPVLKVVDDDPGFARGGGLAPFYVPERLDYASLVTKLVEQPVGELGLRELRPRIEELRSQETSLFVGQMFERTLGVLGASGRAG